MKFQPGSKLINYEYWVMLGNEILIHGTTEGLSPGNAKTMLRIKHTETIIQYGVENLVFKVKVIINKGQQSFDF